MYRRGEEKDTFSQTHNELNTHLQPHMHLETDRQTDRQSDRQTDRQTDSQTDSQTDRQRRGKETVKSYNDRTAENNESYMNTTKTRTAYCNFHMADANKYQAGYRNPTKGSSANT